MNTFAVVCYYKNGVGTRGRRRGDFYYYQREKAISTESLEEFGPVEYVDPGRSADELWVGTANIFEEI